MRACIPTSKLSLITAIVLSLASPIVANSAAPNLADAPIGSISTVLPNIMFILDNSGSMAWRSIVANGTDGTAEYNGSKIEFYNNAFNGIYYNPAVTYKPAKYADGTDMPLPVAPYEAVKENIFQTTTTQWMGNRADGLYTKWCPDKTVLTGLNITTSGVPTTTIPTTCKSTKDSTHQVPVSQYSFYYQWNGLGGSMTNNPFNIPYSNFTRIDIVPFNYDGTPATYTAKNPDGTSTGITRTYAEEIANYATWWMYAGTRMKMMKTSVGRAFQKVVPVAGANPTVRVGFNTISDTSLDTTVGSKIADFKDTSSTGQIGKWYSTLYGTSPGSGTPLRSALKRTGDLYKNGSPYDPVQYSCQRNIAILSTDGYWNTDPASVGIGNLDNVDSGYSKRADGVLENPSAPLGDTLSDIALYYYKTDLRSGMTDNVPVAGNDSAKHQHMSTYTIGLTSGTLKYSKTYETDTSGDFYDIKNNTKNWPKPVQDTKSALDDLWHAAVSGRGYGVVALNQKDVEDGLDRILARASAGIASGAGIGVASPVLSDNNKIVYRTKFDQGTWAGEVEALEVDPITGLPISTTPLWSAATKLDTLASGTGWDSARKIFTRNASGGTPFRWGTGLDYITTTQQTNLQGATPANTAAQGQALLNYLRGDLSNEGTLFRDRKGFNSIGNGILGDIVTSEALVVGAPYRYYDELTDKDYTAFKTSQASRTPMLYFGANDGMVHALKAGSAADSGVEQWAYIPSLVIRPAADNGIGVISRTEGGVPAYQHRFFVNGQAYPNDIDFNNTGTHYDTNTPSAHPSKWGTILVGGLGKGGRGYYALDVSSGAAPANEAVAATKSLWEFTDVNMGYTYGRPTIIKTKKHGWVAIFTSGLNNTYGGGDGKGYIYIVNANNGSLIAKLTTGVGDTTTPSNLMEVSVFESNNTQPFADQIYAGDMLGNLWRFDLRDTSSGFASVWQNSKTLIATLKDGSSNAQPITTRPQIQIDSYSKKRWVFVGTGQYLHDDDRDNTKAMWNRVQTMYAFVDGDTGTPATFTSPVTRGTAGFTDVSNSNTAGVPESSVGWYMDMAGSSGANAAERIVINPVAALDAVGWATTIPTSDVCSSGASGNLYVRQYATAKSLLKDTAGVPEAKESSVDGFVGLRLMKNKYGKVKIVATTPKGNIEIYIPNLTGSSLKQPRVSWRELIEN